MLDALELTTEWLSLAGVTFGVVAVETGDFHAALLCAALAGTIKFAAVRLHRRLWQHIRSILNQRQITR